MFYPSSVTGKTLVMMNEQGYNSPGDIHSAWEDFCQPFNDIVYEYFTPTLKIHGDYMGSTFTNDFVYDTSTFENIGPAGYLCYSNSDNSL